MHSIKNISVIILLGIVLINYAMENPPHSKRHSIAHLAETIASPRLIERLTYIKQMMVEKNLLDDSKPIYLGYLNEQALNYLKNTGCSTQYNRITNGKDSILIEKHLEDLPQDQQDSALAHEMAHIALRNKAAHLNPHNWLENALIGSAEVARWTSVPLLIVGLAGTSEKKQLPLWRKKCIHMGLGCIGLATCNSLIMPILLDAEDTYNNNQPVHYPIMQKLEEIICDLIAATTVPDGARKGAHLYRTLLEHNGNKNGYHGDHPYTSTRIWYHDQLAKILSWTNKI